MKGLAILFCFISSMAFGQQKYYSVKDYGWKYRGLSADTLMIPTGCGVPASLASLNMKRAAIFFDSCNSRVYFYSPKTAAWDTIKGGGSGAYVPLSGTAAGSPVTGNLVVNADIILNGARLKYDAGLTSSYFGEDAGFSNTGSNVNANGYGASKDNTGSNVNANGFNAGNPNTFSNVDLSGPSSQADANKQQVFNNGVANTRWDYNLITADRKLVIPNKSGTVAMLSDISGGTDTQYLRRDINLNTTAINNRYDSLRRLPGSVQVQGKKNNVWINAFVDSTGGGGSISRSTNGDSLIVGAGKVRDMDDPLNSAWYLRNNLKWIEYWQRLTNTNIQDFAFAILGDSKTEFQVVPKALIEQLGAKVKVMGQGYMPVAALMPQLYDAVSLNNTSTWTVNYNGRNLAFYSLTSTSGSSANLGWTINSNNSQEWHKFNVLDVGYWGQAGGGTFDVYVDGVLKVSVNTALTTGVQIATITGLTDAAHSVTIDPTSANAEILHLKPYRTTTNTFRGFFAHNIGHAGAMFSNYLSVDTAVWNPQFRNLNINFLSIYLGTNERHNLVSLATFKANTKTFVARIKAINRQMDIVLWGQVAEQDANAYFTGAIATAAQYNEVLRQVAIEDTLAFFDVDKLAGSYAVNSQKDWLPDGIHEGVFGAYAEAVNFYNGLPSLAGERSIVNEILSKTGTLIYNNGAGGSGITLTGNGTITTPNLVITGTSGTSIAGTTFSSTAGNVTQSALHNQMNWLTSNQGSIQHSFRFANFYSEGQTRQWTQNSNFMRFFQSWQSPNVPNLKGEQVYVGGDITTPDAPSNTIFTQHYLAMTANSGLGRTKLRGYRNDLGDNLLNVYSGSLNIGKDTTGQPSAIFNVNTNNGLNYKGAIPAPRLTTQQRDSIVRGIASITVTGGGTSYSPAPTVTFSPASDAAATAAIFSGVVTSITVEKSGGFFTAPTVTIVAGAAGSGGTATATLMQLPNGLIIFNTTSNQYEVRDSVAAAWVSLAKTYSGSTAIDFVSTSAQTSTEITFTVAGVVAGDMVSIARADGTAVDNAIVNARGSGANTVTAKFNNYSAAAIDPASATYNYKVFK